MKSSLLTLTAVAAILVFGACQGRYADGTPNGETIEVNIVDTTLYPSAEASDSIELPETPSANKVTRVTTNIKNQ